MTWRGVELTIGRDYADLRAIGVQSDTAVRALQVDRDTQNHNE